MRRNNIPRGHRGNTSAPNAMVNNMKLQDLDLELELLKRKREMIEHQQQLLSNERQLSQQRQYGYNQPHQSYSQQQQYDNNQTYSGYYNQSSYSNHSGSGLLGKRSSNTSEWHSPPKRFSGSQRAGGKKKFGSGANSDSKPKPLPLLDQMIIPPMMQQSSFSRNPQIDIWNKAPASVNAKATAPSSRTEYKAPRSFSRDFKTKNKITKNKPPPSSTVPKLVSYPIPQRKKLFEEASQMLKEVDKTSDFVLHADKVPTQQTAGRLELALGFILKTIKTKYGETKEHSVNLQSLFRLRQMKHAIRERLRRVMLGKYVGNLDDIVKQYRKVFPEETDSEIVQIALDARKDVSKKQLAIKIEDADTPEGYYRLNMHKLITSALDEIFEKLQDIYSAESTEHIQTEYRDILLEKNDFYEDVTVDNAVNGTETPAQKIIVETNTEQKTTEEDKTVETNLEEAGKQEVNAEEINTDETKIEEASKEEMNAEEVNTDETKTEEASEEEINIEEVNKDTLAEEKKEVVTEKQVEEVENNVNEEGKGTENKKNEIEIDKQVAIRYRRLDNMISAMLKRRLSSFLPKYKENIIKILNLKSMYESTKNFITSKVEDKLLIDSHIEESKKLNTITQSRANASDTPVSTKPARVLPYYVKIVGHPELPKRRVMQSFLQKYGPKSVKKHKTMHLLFVGFTKKENFERIMAVKRTVLGENTITIMNENADMNDTSDSDVQIIENKTGDDDVQIIDDEENVNKTTSDIINSDLDDQITDLLTSIRKEEEKVDVPIDEQSTEDKGKESTDKTDDLPDKVTDDTEVTNEEQGKTETNGVVTIKDIDEKGTDASDDKKEEEEAKDKVAALKNDTHEQPKGDGN